MSGTRGVAVGFLGIRDHKDIKTAIRDHKDIVTAIRDDKTMAAE